MGYNHINMAFLLSWGHYKFNLPLLYTFQNKCLCMEHLILINHVFGSLKVNDIFET